MGPRSRSNSFLTIIGLRVRTTKKRYHFFKCKSPSQSSLVQKISRSWRKLKNKITVLEKVQWKCSLISINNSLKPVFQRTSLKMAQKKFLWVLLWKISLKKKLQPAPNNPDKKKILKSRNKKMNFLTLQILEEAQVNQMKPPWLFLPTQFSTQNSMFITCRLPQWWPSMSSTSVAVVLLGGRTSLGTLRCTRMAKSHTGKALRRGASFTSRARPQ